MTADPLVSVIIVTYNSAGEIAACIGSVRAHAGVRHEIIVVDNASSDGTVERVRAADPDVQVIVNGENAGFSRANNQAIAVARGRYALFLNPDTELRPGALPALVAALAGGGCVASGPRLVNPDGQVWRTSARRLPTLWTEICQLTALDRMFPASRLFSRKYYAPWNRTSDRDVECLVGAAMLVERERVGGMGGFDESVPLFLDDMDLCRRLGQAGSIRYVRDAVVLHHHDVSSAQQPRRLIERMSLQAVYGYFRKHHGALTPVAYAGAVAAIGVMAWLAGAGMFIVGRRRAALLAMRRSRTLVGWALGRKAGPWTLAALPAAASRRDHLLAPHVD